MPEQLASEIAPWHERQPERLRVEEKILTGLGFRRDENAFLEHQAVVYRGSLADFPERTLIVSFPVSYPSTSPTIQDDGQCPLLRRHQNLLHRNYCLFGPHAEAWHAGLNAGDALAQVADLCQKYGPGSSTTDQSVTSEFPEPNSLAYTELPEECLLVPPSIASILPEAASAIVQGSFAVSSAKLIQPNRFKQRSVVTELTLGNGHSTVKAESYYKQVFGQKQFHGTVYFIPWFDVTINQIGDLELLLKKHGMRLMTNREWVGVIVAEESATSKNTRYAWKAFHRSGKKFQPVETSTYRDDENAARIPGYGFLSAKKIGLIGCGSLGSKIAASLAASGVFKFSLFDPETFEAHNSVRHECGVSSHGLFKVQALAQRLIDINPRVQEHLFATIALGRGEKHSDEVQRIQQLTECDLIIDATGNRQTSRYLNELCSMLNLASGHVSATNGAWSGEIVRSVPGKTACWMCFNHEFGEPEQAPPSEPNPEGDYLYAPGCDQPTFTGTTYDMGIFADIATSFIVDTLKYLDTGNTQYGGDYLVWHNRNADGLPVHQLEVKSTHQREYNDDSRCQYCS